MRRMPHRTIGDEPFVRLFRANKSAPPPRSPKRYLRLVMTMMTNKLRAYRRRAGIPLEVLAYKARVSPRTLWMWERWGCTPRRPSIIERVAAVLGVDPAELLESEGGDQG